MNTVKVESSRLRKLYEDIKVNKEESLQLFWEEVKEKGAPLIEKIEGDNENCLVTLLWREVEPIDNIRVIGEIFGMDPDFTKFYKMEGTCSIYFCTQW